MVLHCLTYRSRSLESLSSPALTDAQFFQSFQVNTK